MDQGEFLHRMSWYGDDDASKGLDKTWMMWATIDLTEWLDWWGDEGED